MPRIGRVEIPGELVAARIAHGGAAGRRFLAELPGRAEYFLREWGLRPDGAAMAGVCALVLPVVRADGLPAVLKLQDPDEETAGEPRALRAWRGDGAVLLLDHDAATGTMLLERLDPARPLPGAGDSREAVLVLAGLLARLTARPAPEGLRQLDVIARELLERAGRELPRVADPVVRSLLVDCAAALREVAGECGDRLLHWDLHFGNVLAGRREPWLVIDPKPLAGDPGFELLPALHNRYLPDEVRWRFEAMTGELGLDRARARAWTLARVLEFCLWELAETGELARPGEPAGAARVLDIAARLRH
ncbi:aminoglycoside phosphotransferase family protein [Streptomyces sp. NPDC058045]|uniref:aminoglycoside phosphotransferase family protein n=1 Tax=Streptomyces sp. NPDC058045 TaxID=3346311 RepID=UPI0036EA7FAA